MRNAEVAQLARASPCQGEGRRFESGLPLHFLNVVLDIQIFAPHAIVTGRFL